MRVRSLAIVGALLVAAASAGAQTYEPPRLPDGKPDLQGVWDFQSLTPLQRPADQDKAVLSAEEIAEIEAAAAENNAAANAPSEVRDEPLPVGGNVGGYNRYWVDQDAGVVDDGRTSLIVDPPTGRLPALQPGVELIELSLGEDRPGTRPVRARAAGIGADSYEDRGLAERCILGFNSGPPIVPAGYNQNIQVFQTPDHVAILNEMVHDARIVPLDGREHLPEGVTQWMGDSRGYWDGDTLVVETTNFSDKTASFNPSVAHAVGTGTTLHLTERFSRVADDTVLYEYTVDDPTSFTAPFTASLPMKRGNGMYEYACHEGNYGLLNILTGARVAELDTDRDPPLSQPERQLWRAVVAEWMDALGEQHYEDYRRVLHSAALEYPEYGSQVAMEFWAQELRELTDEGFRGRFSFERVIADSERLPPGAVRAHPIVNDQRLEEAIVLIEEEGKAGEWKILRLF